MAKEREAEATGRSGVRRDIDDCAIRADGSHPIDDQNHRMWFRASSNNLCPDGMAIESEAWRDGMAKYMRNPVVCDSHRYDSVTDRVIGKSVAWEIDDNGLLLQVEFGVGTQRGADAWYLYRNGYASAGSVGFDPLEREPIKDDDGDRIGDRVTKSQLLEFSGCVIPCDDAALAQKDGKLAEISRRIRSGYGKVDPDNRTRSGEIDPDSRTGGGTDVTATVTPRFKEIEGVEVETREPETDRIDEIIGRLEALSDDVLALTETITAKPERVRVDIEDDEEPAWRRYIREAAQDDDRTFDEVMADLKRLRS